MARIVQTDAAADPTADLQPRGIDATPQLRPGVPMESQPSPDPGAHWTEPARQEPRVEILHRAALPGPTPVFGTGQPPRLLSGALRRAAYRIPETRARHWMLLLAADRVDSTEHRLAGLARLDTAEYRALGRNLLRRPIRSALMLGGAALLLRRVAR